MKFILAILVLSISACGGKFSSGAFKGGSSGNNSDQKSGPNGFETGQNQDINNIDFADGEYPGSFGDGTDGGNYADSQQDPEVAKLLQSGSGSDMIAFCNNNAAKFQEFKQTIVMPQRAGCQPGMDGNGYGVDGVINARFEDIKDVAMPKNAIICNLELNSLSTNVLYDDYLYLVVNDAVMASGQSFTVSRFMSENGFPKWNWAQLKGTAHNDSADDVTYCANGVSCQMPGQERSGPLGMQFSGAAAEYISKSTIDNSGNLKINLVTTGDDNFDIDCRHTEWRFEVKAKFIR